MPSINSELFGTANELNLSSLPELSARISNGHNDPAVIREKLGVTQVKDKLFPIIQSGVRFWPYLVLAHELRNESQARVETTLREIRKEQQNYKEKRTYKREFGPLSARTFAAYRSMYEKVVERRNPATEGIQSLITMRTKFRGHPAFFEKYGSRWRKALLSLGPGAKQFGELLDDARQKKGDQHPLHIAITEVLKGKGFDSSLKKGAFCYALLRCIYGISDGKDGINTTHGQSEWVHLLARNLATPPDGLKNYRSFLPLIEKSKSAPALKNEHKKVRDQNGTVLTGLGFSTFYNLYIAHSPQGVEAE